MDNSETREIFTFPKKAGRENFSKLKSFGFLILVIGILFLIFHFWQKTKISQKPHFIYGYRLVNEKISQSAPIVIYLPKK